MPYSRRRNSQGKGTLSAGQRNVAHKRFYWRMLTIVIFAAAVAVPTLVALKTNSEKAPYSTQKAIKRPKTKTKIPTKIQVDAAEKDVVLSPIQASNELSDAWQKYYDGRDTNKWIVVKDPKTGKEYLSRLMKPGMKNQKKPLYKAQALNVLNAILFKDPGTPLPGVKIDDRFVKSFQDAVLEKIEISAEDSEEDKDLKLGMIATMDYLKNEIKKGGDIKEIVGEALAERNRIASLKLMMAQERINMKNSGATEEEIADFVEACNKKLAEKGASPLLTRQILQERLELKDSRSAK